MTAPDVVYVVRPGDKNEELRYSLRSLRNLPHGKVWIAGYMPKWVTGAEHIPAPPAPRGRPQAKANLRAACENPEVSEEFVYMCDDFFIMRPMDELPVMHRGPLAEVAGMASAYTRAMEKTRTILTKRGIEEPLMYDLHAPMLVTKTGMLEVLEISPIPTIMELSLYGNLNAIGGERRRNHKIRTPDKDKDYRTWDFLSTNDHTFATQEVGEYVRSRFPDPGPYESEPPPPPPAPKVPRPPRPVRRPVRYRAAR